MNVAILVPVLARPKNINPLMANLTVTTPGWKAYFIVDEDDKEERRALKVHQREHPGTPMATIVVPSGMNYASKINVGFEQSDEPLLFTGADDLKFHPGWFELACKALGNKHKIGVVGTRDLGSKRTDHRGIHSTHSLFTREYIDTQGGTMDQGPGVVMFPGYPHEYVDDEFVGTAKHRGVYAHSEAVVEHLHPDWGKARMDKTYRKGRMSHVKSWRVYTKRKHLWGGT